ncbi:MAG: hypothetical protein MJ148_00935 [Clostridia bacterium]|nr:hypothetical protein [Clostridia bacterium]
MSPAEKLKFYLILASIYFILGFLFYRDVIVSAILCFLTIPSKGVYIDYKIKKQKEKLLEGFRDALYSISASIAAGRQMPQAIETAGTELSGSVALEFSLMATAYHQSHAEIGDLLSSFAARSGLSEIKQFADAYRVCKKCGGDLESVCLKSASLLLDKIDFQNEVKMLVSQKKLDIALLTAMPLCVLLFLNLCSYSYIELLYTTIIGRIIMTVSLALIVIALFWGMKITDLKI